MATRIDLQSDSTRLRTTTDADLDFVLKAEHHEDNRPYVTSWSREQHELARSDPDISHLIIESIAERVPAGYCIIAGLTNSHRSIELRRIAVVDKGQGLGRGALRLVKQYAFDVLGAHRLWLDVVSHNVRARRLYETEGFLVEGELRDADFYEGRYQNLVLLSILEDEYRALGQHSSSTLPEPSRSRQCRRA